MEVGKRGAKGCAGERGERLPLKLEAHLAWRWEEGGCTTQVLDAQAGDGWKAREIGYKKVLCKVG